MNHIKRVIIACVMIVGITAVIIGVIANMLKSKDVALKKHIAALAPCECGNRTNLNLQATHWCSCHPLIKINGKLCSEGQTVHGFKIISITAEDIVFICPEDHALKLQRPTGPDLWNPPEPEPDVNLIDYPSGKNENVE